MNEWHSEEGHTVELEIEKRDGTWFVSNPPEAGEIRCVINDDGLIDDTSTTQQITATVASFRQGIGGNDSYLFLNSPDETDAATDQPSKRQQSEQNESQNNSNITPNPTWDLNEFDGSGEYVNVEATIDAVFFVKKDVRGIPDIKGELTDGSVLNPVTFIVEEGVSHPYLEEGSKFLLRNVKDHYYKKQAEVQVVISDNTEFIEQ